MSALRAHWPEYAMEAAELGLFMLAAALGTVLLEHPGSPLHAALPDAFVRRALLGLAMGATAIALTYSPLGQQSGAHFNPAVTLAFFRLGRVARADALAYVVAQFAGGLAGVWLAGAIAGALVAHPAVNYAVTLPGPRGELVAFVAELAISFVLMSVVLVVAASRFARATGLMAGALVALWITFEAPLSGMSMNPARTLASALPAQAFAGLWLYFAAPVAGMLLAAEVYTRVGRSVRVPCAKLHHQNRRRCIHCGTPAREEEE